MLGAAEGTDAKVGGRMDWGRGAGRRGEGRGGASEERRAPCPAERGMRRWADGGGGEARGVLVRERGRAQSALLGREVGLS